MRRHCLLASLPTIMPLSLSLTTPISNIVILGLNPALQKRFLLPPSTPLTPGNVHRSAKVETGVGGKGQDVAIALRCLVGSDDTSSANSIILAQFIGRGAEGDAVLKELEKRSLSTELTVRNDAPLRTCTTIVSSWDATELVENSGAIRPEEMRELLDRVEELTAGKDAGKAAAVCIMGSMPPDCPEDTYAQLTTRLADESSLVLIDSVVGLDPLLETLNNIYGGDNVGGVRGGAVLKLNVAELCKLGNVAKKESECVTLEELKLSTANFMSKYVNARALEYLCITDGKFPGYLVEVPKSKSNGEFRMWNMDTINLSQRGTLFPIGAGDTVAAGTLAAWQYLHHIDSQYDGVLTSVVREKLIEKERKWSQDTKERGWRMATAFAFGIACGSASCLKEENSVFAVEDAVNFLEGMKEPVFIE